MNPSRPRRRGGDAVARRLGALAGSLVVAGAVALAARCTPSVSTPSAAPTSSATTSATGTPSASASTSASASASAAPSRLPLPTPTAGRTLPPPTPSPALTALATLPVRPAGPAKGYARELFGTPYTDSVSETVSGGHNGCDQRNDVRRRDGHDIVLRPRTRGCVVASASFADPYTGLVLPMAATELEHVVALKNAWLTGARELTPQQRVDLAGDPLNLLLVSASVNASKGEKSAATWLPPNETYRCGYVARQIAVKARYRLWVTPAERDRMTAVLRGCPTQTLPTPASVAVPPPVR